MAAGLALVAVSTFASTDTTTAAELPAASVPAASGITPTFDTPKPTLDGFTVNVTNYSAEYAWSAATDAGRVRTGAARSSTWPITVTGLQPGQRATVTVSADMPGLDSSTAIVSGAALPSAENPASQARATRHFTFVATSSALNAKASAALQQLVARVPTGGRPTRLAICVTVPEAASVAQGRLAKQRVQSISRYLRSHGINVVPVVSHPASKRAGIAVVTVVYQS